MSSKRYLLGGLSCMAASFGLPALSIPLLAAAVVLGVLAESERSNEEFWEPVYELQRDAMIDQAEQEIAYSALEIDWRLEAQHDQAMSEQSALIQMLNASVGILGQPTKSAAPIEAPSVSHHQTVQDTLQPVGHNLPDSPGFEPQLGYNQVAERTPLLNLESLSKTAFLMIWGTSGGGKSTLAKRIGQVRASQGHAVTVADPHGAKANWEPWKVIGSGRDYERLNEFLDEFDQDISSDYKLYAVGKTDFKPSTLILDEFTSWGDKCSNSASFIMSACSDIRKIYRHIILVTHSDTLTGLGNAAGLRAAIDRSAVKLELETEIDRESGEYVATGYGWLQYPGKDRERVKIPHDVRA